MKLVHAENYEAMSKEAVDLLLDTLCKKPGAVIYLAIGNSPVRVYELVYKMVNRERIDLFEIIFMKLNEWYGIESQAARTYTTLIRERLLDQLYMQSKVVVEFVSGAVDIRQGLDRMDMFLSKHPIDVMAFGLEMSGHLGLSGPADLLMLNAHYVGLDEETKTYDMVKGYGPKGGLTIGLQGIFTSGQILTLVYGNRKEAAYQAFMSQRTATSTPASLLRLHLNCVMLVSDTIQK